MILSMLKGLVFLMSFAHVLFVKPPSFRWNIDLISVMIASSSSTRTPTKDCLSPLRAFECDAEPLTWRTPISNLRSKSQQSPVWGFELLPTNGSFDHGFDLYRWLISFGTTCWARVAEQQAALWWSDFEIWWKLTGQGWPCKVTECHSAGSNCVPSVPSG